MSFIEVDPALLQVTGSRLRNAVEVGTEVAHRNGELAALAADSGSGHLTDAVQDFMGRWAHGLSCLVEDAEKLAGLLADAGHVYLEVETSVVEAAGGGR